MLFIFLLITFVVAFNFGLLAGCALSSRRIEKIAEQKALLSGELHGLKSMAAEKTSKSEGDESPEFVLREAHCAPRA